MLLKLEFDIEDSKYTDNVSVTSSGDSLTESSRIKQPDLESIKSESGIIIC